VWASWAPKHPDEHPAHVSLLGSALGPVLVVAFIVLWIGLVLASVGVWIWMLVDACQRPEWAYTQTGSNKTLWIVLIAVLGWIAALIYLCAIRSKVRGFQEAYEGGMAQVASSPSPWGAPGGFCARCGSPSVASALFCTSCGARR
jgi:hypothetical protein